MIRIKGMKDRAHSILSSPQYLEVHSPSLFQTRSPQPRSNSKSLQ